jgi:tRNA(fMet)-specific endonuclease VapC
MPFLLDTVTLSDLVRNPLGRVASRIAEVGEAEICTSVIVASELRFGALKRGSPALTDRVNGTLARLSVRAFEPPADDRYAEVRLGLERAGTPIGGNDLLIAAHALALGQVLVTDNVREFSRVRGLVVENWLS